MALTPGFEFDEVTSMIALSQAIYGVPAIPKPTPDPGQLGWTLDSALSPSGPTLLDNLWQVWCNDAGQYAIVVRGTVDTAPSILADLLFPLIDARLDLVLRDKGVTLDIPFHLARDEPGSAIVAGTHFGFTASLMLMLLTTDRPLLATLFELALKPGAEVFITGHSQGASIATLLTSFVRHASGPFADIAKASYKTYVFAPAKPGNDHYGYDYDFIAGQKGNGWTIVSTQGWVPQAPFTLELPSDLNTPNPLREYGAALDVTVDPDLAKLTVVTEPAVEVARQQHVENAGKLDARIKAGLAGRTLAITHAHLGGKDAIPVSGDSVSSLIDEFLSKLQRSLNFAYAGSLVPLFATPGGNPDDPSDFFWQHHLGNYWIYLQKQYG